MTILLVCLLLGFNPDQQVLDGVRTSLRSDFSNTVFRTLSRSGDGEVLVFSMLSYAVLGGPRAQSQVKTLGVTAIPLTLVVQGIKIATGRLRPDGTNRKSLPSGHAASAFLFAEYFSDKFPNLRIPFYLWATGVGLSRIYLNRHWPSDVILGTLIGILVARIGIHYEQDILDFRLFR
jgi:membrane-associated phospholipid phosphatase